MAGRPAPPVVASRSAAIAALARVLLYPLRDAVTGVAQAEEHGALAEDKGGHQEGQEGGLPRLRRRDREDGHGSLGVLENIVQCGG